MDDFSDSQTQCPAGFNLYEESGVRGCGPEPSTNGVCASLIIPTGISYTQVCGKVQGYQYGSTDAFQSGHNDIETFYLDGITYGSPGARQHIFSLVAGFQEYSTDSCPCNLEDNIPSFVGQDYYNCESANALTYWGFTTSFYGDDVLWDGNQCNGREGPCCTSSNFPYFYKHLGSATTDDIELRVCVNQDTETDENILLESYEIYVKNTVIDNSMYMYICVHCYIVF